MTGRLSYSDSHFSLFFQYYLCPMHSSIDSLLALSSTPKSLKAIGEKVLNGKRITASEGLLLFEKGELSFLGMLANHVREKKNGNATYFNRNFHIEPTNVCVFT